MTFVRTSSHGLLAQPCFAELLPRNSFETRLETSCDDFFSALLLRPSLRTSARDLLSRPPLRTPLKTSSDDFSPDILSFLWQPRLSASPSTSWDFFCSRLLLGPLLKTSLCGAHPMTSFEDLFPRPPLAKAFRTSSHDLSEDRLSRPVWTFSDNFF